MASKPVDDMEAELDTAMAKIENLLSLQKSNSNFRSLDGNQLQIARGTCLVNRGRMKHQRGAIRAEGLANKAYQQYLDEWCRKASADYASAMRIFSDRNLMQQEGRQCKKGQGNTFVAMGKLTYLQEKLEETKPVWQNAMECFSEIRDEEGMEEVTELLEQLELELNRVNSMKSRRKELATSSNNEYEQIKAAFYKFDKDKSGQMDASEFGLLAIELGTDPPLRPEELAEGLQQLDQDGTGDISFEEFWAWWCEERTS